MPFANVLVHKATPLRRHADQATVVEGEDSGGDDLRGTSFSCCVFLPEGNEQRGQGAGGSRRIRRPMMLCAALDDAGMPYTLSHEDEVLVVAPELNVAEGLPTDAEVRWQVQGSPQPFGRPGRAIIGKQVTLSRVEEAAPEQAVED